MCASTCVLCVFSFKTSCRKNRPKYRPVTFYVLRLSLLISNAVSWRWSWGLSESAVRVWLTLRGEGLGSHLRARKSVLSICFCPKYGKCLDISGFLKNLSLSYPELLQERFCLRPKDNGGSRILKVEGPIQDKSHRAHLEPDVSSQSSRGVECTVLGLSQRHAAAN